LPALRDVCHAGSAGAVAADACAASVCCRLPLPKRFVQQALLRVRLHFIAARFDAADVAFAEIYACRCRISLPKRWFAAKDCAFADVAMLPMQQSLLPHHYAAPLTRHAAPHFR